MSAKIIKEVVIDTINDRSVIIPANQLDSGRNVKIKVCTNNTPHNLTDCRVEVGYMKPDGIQAFNPVEIINAKDGIVNLQLTPQMLITDGIGKAQLFIYDGANVVSTRKFKINIAEIFRATEEIESTPEFGSLDRALNEIQDINNKIMSKRDKNDPIRSSEMDISSDANKIKMINLSDEIKKALSGNAPVSPIIPDNGITTEKYADGSITTEKMMGTTMLNILNKNTNIKNKVFNVANNGDLIFLSGAEVTDYVLLKSRVISCNWNDIDNFIGMYDKNKAWIGVLKGKIGKIYTVPSNCAYIRVNLLSDVANKLSMIYGNHDFVPESLNSKSAIDWLLIDDDNIDSISISKINTTYMLTKLFNIEKATMEKVVMPNGTLYNLKDHGVSDYIMLKGGNNYTFYPSNLSNMGTIFAMDKSTVISNISGKNPNGANLVSHTITVTQDCYIRLNFAKIHADVVSLNKGDTIDNSIPTYNGDDYLLQGLKIDHAQINPSNTPYKLEGLKINANDIEGLGQIDPSTNPLISKWTSKQLVLFGDSITYWDNRPSWVDPNYLIKGYPTYIKEILNPNITNKGSAGATISTIVSANSIHNICKATNLSNVHAIIITGGTNDLNQKSPIGNIGTIKDTMFDNGTYIGALRSMIEYAYMQNPFIKIYLMSPLKMRNNDDGLKPYCEAMQQVSDLYGIPILRLDKILQINEKNMNTLTFDGCHPKNEGYKMMSDLIIPFLMNN